MMLIFIHQILIKFQDKLIKRALLVYWLTANLDHNINKIMTNKICLIKDYLNWEQLVIKQINQY